MPQPLSSMFAQGYDKETHSRGDGQTRLLDGFDQDGDVGETAVEAFVDVEKERW